MTEYISEISKQRRYACKFVLIQIFTGSICKTFTPFSHSSDKKVESFSMQLRFCTFITSFSRSVMDWIQNIVTPQTLCWVSPAIYKINMVFYIPLIVCHWALSWFLYTLNSYSFERSKGGWFGTRDFLYIHVLIWTVQRGWSRSLKAAGKMKYHAGESNCHDVSSYEGVYDVFE